MGYADGPPWVFTGKALYQLHLVKASEARRHVPASLPLVQLFGYTLGGVFLARYSTSPVGPFDELVTIAGLVWNFPGSAAWASRVYVSNREACAHGRQHCGLPSSVADFELLEAGKGGERQAGGGEELGFYSLKKPHDRACGRAGAGRRLALYERPGGRRGGALLGPLSRFRRRSPARDPVCCLQLPAAFSETAPAGAGGKQRWQGPRLRLQLPNYSGGIPECPGLLQYTCRLAARLLPAKPLQEVGASQSDPADPAGEDRAVWPRILRPPIVTLLFNSMSLSVAQPQEVPASPRRQPAGLQLAGAR